MHPIFKLVSIAYRSPEVFFELLPMILSEFFGTILKLTLLDRLVNCSIINLLEMLSLQKISSFILKELQSVSS